MHWLLEPEVFKGDLEPFIEQLEKLNIDHTICKFGVPYESYISDLKDKNVIFQGSLQFAKKIRELANWKGLYCNLPKLDCAYYYPRIGKYLLNSNYVLLPFGELHQRYHFFSLAFDTFTIFIRPTSMGKSFTGMVLNVDNWDSEIKKLNLRMNPEDLVLIAPATIFLTAEYRLIIVNNKVVAGSQYKKLTKNVRFSILPDEVVEYATGVLNNVKYNPDPAWVLDICEIGNKGYRVLEVGSFSCSGLYAADPVAIIKSIGAI